MTRSRRTINDVLASLRAHPQLTVLMSAGPAVGVAVLSAVIVMAQGTEERIMGLVQKHGLDMIMVRAGGEVQVFAQRIEQRGARVEIERVLLAVHFQRHAGHRHGRRAGTGGEGAVGADLGFSGNRRGSGRGSTGDQQIAARKRGPAEGMGIVHDASCLQRHRPRSLAQAG